MEIISNKTIARLVGKININETLAIFRFDLRSTTNFIPGQYITLYFIENEKRIARPYSIASNPNELPIIDLYIKLITEEGKGVFTKKLFSSDIGTEFKVLKICGDFILDNEDNREIIMVCSGTGIGPYISMIMDRVEKVKCGKKFSNKIFLLQGISYKKDISFTEEIEEAKDLGVIKEYIPSLSREKNGFHSGKVDILLTNGTIEKILGSYLDRKNMLYIYADILKWLIS